MSVPCVTQVVVSAGDTTALAPIVAAPVAVLMRIRPAPPPPDEVHIVVAVPSAPLICVPAEPTAECASWPIAGVAFGWPSWALPPPENTAPPPPLAARVPSTVTLGASRRIAPPLPDGYYQVIGDGNALYAQESNTGANSVGPQPYITSPETDGKNWSPYQGGAQTFADGPYSMRFDPIRRVLYSSNWRTGVWALKVL